VGRCCKLQLASLPNVTTAAALSSRHGRPPLELGKMMPTTKTSAMARAELGMAGDGRSAGGREGYHRWRGGWPAAGRGLAGGGEVADGGEGHWWSSFGVGVDLGFYFFFFRYV
jgi:hypothetical protein